MPIKMIQTPDGDWINPLHIAAIEVIDDEVRFIAPNGEEIFTTCQDDEETAMNFAATVAEHINAQ